MAISRSTPLTPAIPLLWVALSLAGCEAGEVTLVGPDEARGGGTSLEVRVQLDDAALAEALDWKDGVPDAPAEWAFVHHRRYLFHHAVSDESGVIRFEPEGRGWHWIAAEKEVEIDGERRVLGGGAKTHGSTELSLNLDDPGTLVISEVSVTMPPPWETGGESYAGSKYIELYNNSAEVGYLDGMVLGVAYDLARDLSKNGHHSCAYTKPFREDPEAVWSRSHWRFPGSGTDHPIAPGDAVVVAVSAADHTGVHASMLDLSDAEFEFATAGAADNPAAVNLINVSSDYGGPSAFNLSSAFWFLANPVEVASLDVLKDEWAGGTATIDYRGFPADAILDVSIQWWDTTSESLTSRDTPPCEHPIHPRFDELPGGYLYGEARPEDLLVSPQRRVVRTEGGRPVLQDTNTSAVDFENVARTPGWIP